MMLAVVPLLLSISTAPMSPAAPQTVDPNTSFNRFGSRTLYAGGLVVHASADPKGLLVRAMEGATPQSVAAQVERAIAEAMAGQPRPARLRSAVDQPSTPLGFEQLFWTPLTASFSSIDLARIAARMTNSGTVRQVYPMLRRGDGRAFYDDHLILTAKPEKLASLLERVLPIIDGTLVRHSNVPDTALVRVGAALAFDAVLASQYLTEKAPFWPELHAAEPNLLRELTLDYLINDPLAGEQWHLFRHDQTVPGLGEIFANDAWDVTLGDPQVVIAVFDSGVDLTHPDLFPNVIDGFDAANGDENPIAECSPSAGGRLDPVCPASAPYREAHATSVSGLAVGRGNNSLGTSGVCPLCSLMPVRLIGTVPVASSLTVGEAFVRAVDDGAWVINNSWGPGYSRYFPLSSAELDALHYARFRGRNGLGTVVVFAAGNDGSDVVADAYASQPDVMAIAASTNLDDWAIYSSWGDEIDVAAPSLGGFVPEDSYGIVTTDVSGEAGYDGSDFTFGFSGTSASSPVAAGVAGLVLSANPDLTADQVRIILQSTADKIRADKLDWVDLIGEDLEALWEYDENGHSAGFGYGRVNAAQAVAAALNPPLQGSVCPDAGCAKCNDDLRCQEACTGPGQCPAGTICVDNFCVEPAPEPTEIGQPCSAACSACLPALDSDFNTISICTETCTNDDECPVGFDCRWLDPEGPALCTLGLSTAGLPADPHVCFDDLFWASILVESGDQAYCSDICPNSKPDTCPYGFHCGAAFCSCDEDWYGYCFQYTCREASGVTTSNWPMQQCFPDDGFGITCTIDLDCRLGDYCGPDGSCRRDDRAGCLTCVPCETSDDCGPRGACRDFDDGTGRHCAIACNDDGTCPGDSVCREIESYHGRVDEWCLAPFESAEDPACPTDYVCAVPCRDDLPCPEGEICTVIGTCVPEPPPDPKQKKGCDCDATASPLGAGWALLGCFSWWRRRHSTRT